MNGNDSAGTGTPEKPLERLVYRLPEAGHLLSISRRKVHDLIEAGELETVPIGSLRMVPRESIESYIERQRAKAQSNTAPAA